MARSQAYYYVGYFVTAADCSKPVILRSDEELVNFVVSTVEDKLVTTESNVTILTTYGPYIKELNPKFSRLRSLIKEAQQKMNH